MSVAPSTPRLSRALKPLTTAAIVAASEQILREHGAARMTLGDVAQVLRTSTASVRSLVVDDAALCRAVAFAWLKRLSEPLGVVAAGDSPPTARLRAWFDLIIKTKRSEATAEPELFAAHSELALRASDAVDEHIETLLCQLMRIVDDGIWSDEFSVFDEGPTARALFMATRQFHDPRHAAEWEASDFADAFEEIWAFMLRALTSQSPNVS